MANGQPRPAFYVAVFSSSSASSASRLWRYGAIGPGSGSRRRSPTDELKQIEGRRRGARQLRHHDGQGIQLRRRAAAARGQGHLELQADGGPHRPVRDQRVGRLEPDHLRQQRLQAGQGLEDAGRQGLQGRARAHRRSDRDARRLRRRQPPRRLGDARHGAAVPRRACARTRASCRASTSRSTGRTAATASSSATRSRRWPTCAGRRSCSRRTRRRTSSC